MEEYGGRRAAIDRRARVWVAGHTGLVGSAVLRALRARGYQDLVLRTHREADLEDRAAAEAVFRETRPEAVVLAAGVAGGIEMNRTQPARLISVNLAIAMNMIDLAHRYGVRKLLFLGSACAYPRICPQPIAPEALLAGPLEPTSEPFAVSKIAGIRMCQAYRREHGSNFICVIPATVYGPGDHFGPDGHVIASLLARFHEAKVMAAPAVTVWGTGTPRREFLHADDAGEGLALLLERYDDARIANLGAGADISIADLAGQVAAAVGYRGDIVFDRSRPDGMPARLLDSSAAAALGFRPRLSLAEGLSRTYSWYCEQSSEKE